MNETPSRLQSLLRLLGSIKIAVVSLIAIGAVLAWGTIYETRFGTAAVQRFIYHAWWFQALLGFLAVNLAVAAIERYPWKRHQAPFVLTHIGIILFLVGGILGGRFGIEGQMAIPEGQAERTLELPANVLVVHLPAASAAQAGQPNPALHQILPTRFETQAWVHEPNVTLPVTLDGRSIQLTVDRYYPDAVMDEQISDDGPDDNPAVHVLLEDQGQQDAVWLFARDPERFGTGWGEAHVLFLEAKTRDQVDRLLGGSPKSAAYPQGVLTIRLPGMKAPRDIPVPGERNQRVAVDGTPYAITFKDYVPDFAMTEQGVVSRSNQPNNPAVSFTLSGPEGADAYLLFALHPDFQAIHGFEHQIAAEVQYTHTAHEDLPPNCVGVIRTPAGSLVGVLTTNGSERTVINPLEIDRRYTHPSLGYVFSVSASYPRAKVAQHIRNRGDEVKAETLHVIGREGDRTAQAWIGLRQTVPLDLGTEPILVEYGPARRELPVTIKLLDFRKIDYPGTQMASGFESDVQLTDSPRGIILMRTISMNNPLRYRGFSFYQSSYIDGPTQTTILSVRSDPGTPLVYAGFLVVIVGVVSMFVLREPFAGAVKPSAKTRIRTRSRA